MKLVKVNDLFEVKNGNGFELINLEEVERSADSVNFISRTEKNNGISSYVERNNIKPFSAGTITVAVGGSVLATFLQPEPYYTGFHIQILIPKKAMTDEEMLFFVYCIRKNKYRYNYGRQANKTLKDILIPEKMPKEWENISLKKINTIKKEPLQKNNFKLNVNSWTYFNLTDLFEITGSKTTSILDLEEYGKGKYPFVTTQATNNGVEGFYDFYTEEGNILTIDSAVLGYCSYQLKNFSASDHVEKLIPKFKLNKYIALFLTTILNKEQYRYNYGRKASQTRLEERNIKLPSKNKNPDWQFMEDYVKSLPYSASL